jgi:hypothetical protein
MSWMLILLYLAMGVGCGALRLSALAVGLLATVPAAFGVIVGYTQGASHLVLVILAPILLIESSYFLTMLLVERLTRREKVETPLDAHDTPLQFSQRHRARRE